MKISTHLAAVVSLSVATVAFGADPKVVTGYFAPGEKVISPEWHAPAEVSRMFVRNLELASEGTSLDLPIAGDGGLIVWTIPIAPKGKSGAAVQSSLVTPRGRQLAGSDKGSRQLGLRRFAVGSEELELDLPESSHEVIHVADAEAGMYHLTLSPREALAATVVAAEPDSVLVLETWAGPLSRKPGEPVVLYARLAERERGIADARITARLAPAGGSPSDAIELFDDGAHADGAARDGVFGVTLADLPSAQPGSWSVRFEAEGRTPRGRAFARTGAAGFVNERRLATIDRESLRIEAGSTELVVKGRVSTDVAGTYRLDVIVSSGEEGVVWGESVVELARGEGELSLTLPRDPARMPEGRSYNYDIRLLGLEPMGVADRIEKVAQH